MKWSIKWSLFKAYWGYCFALNVELKSALPSCCTSRNYGNEQPSSMFLRPRLAQLKLLAFFRSQASHCQPFSQLLTAALIITISNGQSLLSDGKVQHGSTMFNLGPWWTWAIFSHFSHPSRHKTGNDYVNGTKGLTEKECILNILNLLTPSAAKSWAMKCYESEILLENGVTSFRSNHHWTLEKDRNRF